MYILCRYTHIHICIYINTYKYVSIYLYIYKYIHIYIHMCMYMYVYIYMRSRFQSANSLILHAHHTPYSLILSAKGGQTLGWVTYTHKHAHTNAHAKKYHFAPFQVRKRCSRNGVSRWIFFQIKIDVWYHKGRVTRF